MKAKVFVEKKINEGLNKEEVRAAFPEYQAVAEEPILSFIAYSATVDRMFSEIVGDTLVSQNLGKMDASNAGIVGRTVQLARQKQLLQDQNRLLNKEGRERNRRESLCQKLLETLLAELPNIKVPSKIPKLKENPKASFGIMQFSDHHMNELIHEDEVGNAYDFSVASSRLRKMVDETDRFCKAFGVTHLLLAFVGDLINSDRRLDETLNKATNRMRAALLAAHLYQQMMEDLIARGYTLSIASVTGNESRLAEIPEHSDLYAADNFDFLINGILRGLFAKNSRVQFLDGDLKELVVSIENMKILLLHGESVKKDGDVKDLYAKWAQKGVLLDYVLYGHIHSAMISDTAARGSSLCGTNVYADKGLGLYGRASQNIHVVMKDKSIHSLKVDLQNAPEEGYAVNKKLEEYNAKSARKLVQKDYIVVERGA